MKRKSLRAMRRDAIARMETQAGGTEYELVRPRKHRNRPRNRHHLIPKSRGGARSEQNLLYIDKNVHFNWHLVFGNRTLDEIIALLIRVRRAKLRQ